MKDEEIVRDPDSLLTLYVKSYLNVSDRLFIKHKVTRYDLLKQIKKMGLMNNPQF